MSTQKTKGARRPILLDLFDLPADDPLANLRRMAGDPANALELGKAAEHLVAADLILQGRRCYLSDQGLPYDLVVDTGERLLRIQCKAACFAKNVSMQGRVQRIAYSFSVRRRGKHGSKRLTNNDCDVIALVALDRRIIGYFPIHRCASTMQIPVERQPLFLGRNKTLCGTSAALADFTFERALHAA